MLEKFYWSCAYSYIVEYRPFQKVAAKTTNGTPVFNVLWEWYNIVFGSGNILSHCCVICPLELWFFRFNGVLRMSIGPEEVKFPCSCPSFVVSVGWFRLNCLGQIAALGPLEHFSARQFVRWQWGQGANGLDAESFVLWSEGSFLCSCSFFVLLRQSLLTWLCFFYSKGIRF